MGGGGAISSRQSYFYWPSRWSYGGYYGGAEHFAYVKGSLVVDLRTMPGSASYGAARPTRSSAPAGRPKKPPCKSTPR
jgi:hypothetical protein